MKRLSFALLILAIALCFGVTACARASDHKSLRRILPTNLLGEITWGNLVRLWRFIMFNFNEWFQNKAITVIFKNIAANLS